MLRWKVREQMRFAPGAGVPTGTGRRYFQHVGWMLSSSLATFHHGLAATPVVDEVKFDEAIGVLDDAFAEGRGVREAAKHNGSLTHARSARAKSALNDLTDELQ